MSSKNQRRGLGGGSILGAHLDMPTPTLVRRTADDALPDVEGEGGETAPTRPTLRDVSDQLVALPSGTAEPALHDATEDSLQETPSEASPADNDGSAAMAASPNSGASRVPRSPKAKLILDNSARVGSKQNPYARKRDGIPTMKISVTIPHTMKRLIERACFDRDMKPSEWIVAILEKELAGASKRTTNR